MPGLSTRAVHAGERSDPSGAVNTPIVQSTTYRYPETVDGGQAPYIYSRYDNPTVQALEGKVAALEGAPGALAFGSGMGAIATVCQALTRSGDTIAVMDGVYGGTIAYMGNELARAGVKVERFDAFAPGMTSSADATAAVPRAGAARTTAATSDAGGLPRAVPEGVKLVWLESITNPLLRVPDVQAWAEATHEVGALLVVDATFATPVLQRPLELGADIVVHSATKYLGGHSDVTAGVLAARQEHLETLWQTRRNLGATLDPAAAALVARGIKTLPLRIRAQTATAGALAGALNAYSVVQVHYPGLPSHPDRAVSGRVLEGAGAMLTLDLGTLEAAQRFRRCVRIITPAASLGGVESLVSLPLETSHAYASAKNRQREGITDGLVRISVGLEDEADLLEDIEQALG